MNTTMASIQKLPSGNWRVLIRSKGHKAISETFTTEKLAKAFAKEKARQLEEIKATGRAAAPKGSTVAHYIDDYLDYIQQGRTLQRSALFIYKALKKRLGNIGIERLSKSHLESFIDARKKRAFRVKQLLVISHCCHLCFAIAMTPSTLILTQIWPTRRVRG
ncbi:hypothetical protein LRS56_18210 [Pseudomonas poae]|nr:hypothetical protein LRS56_18210 [Pseudomonas poae]